MKCEMTRAAEPNYIERLAIIFVMFFGDSSTSLTWLRNELTAPLVDVRVASACIALSLFGGERMRLSPFAHI